MEPNTFLQGGLLLGSLYSTAVAGWMLFFGGIRESAGGMVLLIGGMLLLLGSLNFQGLFLWPGALLLALGAGISLPEGHRTQG